MSLPVIVIGAGGHGKVVADALQAAGRKVLGFVDPKLAGKRVIGLPVLGGDEVLRRYSPNKVELANGRGSASDLPGERKRLFEEKKALKFRFVQVIHPSATVSRHARLGEGVQVMAGAVIQADTHVDRNCIVNTGATIDHDCRIGAHCHIAPGVTLSGSVQIGAESHIGVGAIVIQEIRIGTRVLVAAGAVVVDNVADGKLVMGVPAEVQKK